MLIAEIQLRNWVSQIVYATNEGQPISSLHLKNTTECAFGLWYESEDRHRYEQHPVFAEIDAPHCRLHELANRMDQLWREGKLEQCRALIPEILAARDKTLALLQQLQHLVGVIRH